MRQLHEDIQSAAGYCGPRVPKAALEAEQVLEAPPTAEAALEAEQVLEAPSKASTPTALAAVEVPVGPIDGQDAPPASGSNGDGLPGHGQQPEPVGGDGLDLTAAVCQAPLQETADASGQMVVAEEEEVSLKELFLAADIIVPTLALKKFSQILKDKRADAGVFMGVLAADMVKRHRAQRRRLCSLAVGDALTSSDSFWQSAQGHCQGRQIGGVFIFDVFQHNICEVGKNKPQYTVFNIHYCDTFFKCLSPLRPFKEASVSS